MKSTNLIMMLLIAVVALLVLDPHTALAANSSNSNTPGAIMNQQAAQNFNSATFIFVAFSVVCFLGAIVGVFKKEYGWAISLFVGGIFALGITSCVNKMDSGGIQQLNAPQSFLSAPVNGGHGLPTLADQSKDIG